MAVVSYASHLHALQEASELDHFPAKPGHVGLHQIHLVDVDSQESLDHATILCDYCTHDQVTIVQIQQIMVLISSSLQVTGN